MLITLPDSRELTSQEQHLVDHLEVALVSTELLDGGLDTLVYSGDKDFICNWRGGEAWTDAVEWTGHANYSKAKYNDW